MKHHLIFVLFIVSSSFLTSCLDLGDVDNTYYYSNMATVAEGGSSPKFILDNGVELEALNSQPVDTFQVGERYYLYYYYGDTTNYTANHYPIMLEEYYKAFFKDFKVLDKDSTDIFGDEPIRSFNYVWFSANYLNIIFSEYDMTSSSQTFELIRNKNQETSTRNDLEPELYFEFRSSISGSASSNYHYKFVSYNFDTLLTQFPKAISHKVHIKWNALLNDSTETELKFVPTY